MAARAWTIVVVAIVLMSAGYGIYRHYYAEEEKTTAIVEVGDTVYINYTGWLADPRIYNELRVFDTSRAEVAADNRSYPKTVTFDFTRPRNKPYKFVVGEGQVIQGWEKRIVGLEAGKKYRWVIPPSEGYQPRLDALIVNISVYEVWPLFESISKSEFTSLYGEPYEGMAIVHEFWGWTAIVFDVSGEDVTIQNLPEIDAEYISKYGWKYRVIAVDQAANNGTGEITIMNMPSIGDKAAVRHVVRHIKNLAYVEELQREQQGGMSDGIVVAVDVANITIDFNKEVYGRTLIFDVVIEKVEKGKT